MTPDTPLTASRPILAPIPVICSILTFAVMLWNTVDINYPYAPDEDQIALDAQVVIKLILAVCCGAMGLVGILMSPRVRVALTSIPGCLLGMLAAVLIATSTMALAEVANVSRAAAVINLGYLGFVPTALAALGLRHFLVAALAGLVVNLIANWGLYFLLPSIGVFEEALSGQTLVYRMGGLGHPNAIARTAVLAGFLCMVLWRQRPTGRWPFIRIVLISILVLAAVTIVAAASRTAYIAAVAGTSLVWVDKFLSRGGTTLILLAAVGMLAGCIAFVLTTDGGNLDRAVLGLVTKTGDVEELTSATGRTEIWAEAIRRIRQRPWTGWGLNSAPVLLQDHSLHTHNLVLHAAFSGGVLAGILVVALLAWNLFFGLISPEPLVRAISIYILVSGVFEDTVLDTFASPSMLLWLVVLLYPTMAALCPTLAFDKNAASTYNESPLPA